MQAINKINTGIRKIPDNSDGIFIAVDAVIPENITAIVMMIADQKPKEISLWFISDDEYDDSFLDMIPSIINYRMLGDHD
jgi:hypothetical protein